MPTSAIRRSGSTFPMTSRVSLADAVVVTVAPASSRIMRSTSRASGSSSTTSTFAPVNRACFFWRFGADASAFRRPAAGQSYRERRALADARALRVHRAAMHPDQVVHDSQTQPETAMGARCAAVALTETFEHVRQEIRIDAASGICHDDLDEPGLRAANGHLDTTACRREPHGIRQQVPDDLLQPAGIGRVVRAAGSISFRSARSWLRRPAGPIRARRRSPVR